MREIFSGADLTFGLHNNSVTFPLGLLELPARRLDVPLHQRPDHLLPIRHLAVLGAFFIGLGGNHRNG